MIEHCILPICVALILIIISFIIDDRLYPDGEHPDGEHPDGEHPDDEHLEGFSNMVKKADSTIDDMYYTGGDYINYQNVVEYRGHGKTEFISDVLSGETVIPMIDDYSTELNYSKELHAPKKLKQNRIKKSTNVIFNKKGI